MAATTDIVINNFAAAAKTFIPTVQLPKGYQYRDSGSTADAPRTIDVLHEMGPSGSASNSKHTVVFRQVRANSAGQLRTEYVKVEYSKPVDGTTPTDSSDLGAFVRNFLTDANLGKLMLGGF